MKAARLHRYDDSIPKDSLTVEEIDEPKIEGPFDVIIRIGAAGLVFGTLARNHLTFFRALTCSWNRRSDASACSTMPPRMWRSMGPATGRWSVERPFSASSASSADTEGRDGGREQHVSHTLSPVAVCI